MKTQRITRQSLNGVEYQIEYTLTPNSAGGEYRVRRGNSGSWTAWIASNKIATIIHNLGFASAVNDFTFEALLSRGCITLNKDMVAELANSVGSNALSRHIYSRLKRINDDTWILPSRAIINRNVFNYLKNLISSKS